ncbi:L-type lectin-domain containing receptor kinase VIII.2 [Ricinus communis]|uniref:Agglutinin-2, putative n=1 Tax=Ricinus communis TaxID=3988 RepID=B9SPG3_RICCO|nr:L-type lectin-domain containing receptor kinase VIII.2 [Ricinus communis]XP_048225624.1 L-type lectin-domain containing receptor kinase VIII.2 [Ricinus communis]EEF34513.1 Agglutinin-2 precursor, putative [Ricinus communis]|eukprot:XP_002527882.1 L-type lectin-domain containing receptor kinase VIII.2 [Ricinus communis]
MAAFSISACFICLSVSVFHFNLLSADQSSSFSFQSFHKDPNFDSNIALYGDASAVNNGSVLQLTRSVSSSAGHIMYKKPIKLVEGNPINLVSFSSYISFSMSSENGDGLAFVMVSGRFNVSALDSDSPFGFSLRLKRNNSEFIAVEFDTRKDAEYGDLNDNHVGVNVGGFVSAKVKNASSVNIVLNNGKRLSSWIDYEAGSRRLEVRLSKFGNIKPMDPLLSYPIDLSKLWKDEKFYIGLSSSNRNSSQACLIYSWSFEQRHVPQWMHSQPLDPQAFAKDVKPGVITKQGNCFLRVLATMIFGTACGALGAFSVLYLWTIFGNRRPVVPEECSVHPVEFEYKKVKVVVEKAVEDGKQ